MYHKHHRKRRSQGGTDDPSNILKVTPEIHDWIHANPQEAYDLGWLVHSYEEPEEVVVCFPENLKMKPPKKAKPETPRTKVTVTIKVPKDEQEDGAEVLQTLIEECRKELVGEMGWQENVPAYFVLSAVLANWLQGRDG